jgi:hypothetical protein
MTVTDLEKSVRGTLQEAGLLQYLDEDQTQFLEFPDGWFAEVVVKDGSKLSEVERVVERYKEHLRRNDADDLDEIVRPVWSIAKVERVGPSVSFPGLEPAVRFVVTLQSGSLSCDVKIDLTEGALALIRERLHETEAPEDTALQEIVCEFVNLELSHGGESYWDPRRGSRLELGAAAFMYLMGHRDALKMLKAEIDAVFGGRTEDQILGLGSGSPGQVNRQLDEIRGFVQGLDFSGVRIEDFENALLYLPGPGGAFRPGQRLPTSNRELYETLFDDEKADLRSIYLSRVREALEDYPELKKEFPKVLRS